MTNVTTMFENFSVTTRPSDPPEGRDWGARHWRFEVTAVESGAMHRGYYSVGEMVDWSSYGELHRSVLESLGLDAPAALEGGGNVLSQLEALDAEGAGYGLAEGYRVAVELVRFHKFVSALTEAEFAALTGDGGDDE